MREIKTFYSFRCESFPGENFPSTRREEKYLKDFPLRHCHYTNDVRKAAKRLSADEFFFSCLWVASAKYKSLHHFLQHCSLIASHSMNHADKFLSSFLTLRRRHWRFSGCDTRRRMKDKFSVVALFIASSGSEEESFPYYPKASSKPEC